MFVPPTKYPIDLIWDEPTVAGHIRRMSSFSRLILTDLLGRGAPTGSGSRTYRRSSPGRTDFWPSSTPWERKRFDIHDGRRRAACICWPRAIPIGCDRSCCGALRGFCAPPTIRAASLKRMHTEYHERVRGAVRDRCTDRCAEPSWAMTPQDGAGGTAVADRRRSGVLEAMFGLWIRSDLRPVLGSVQAPTLVFGGAVTKT